jgi:ABC-type amino acid transport substrate-binding protein
MKKHCNLNATIKKIKPLKIMNKLILSTLLPLFFLSSTLWAKNHFPPQQVVVWNQLLTHPNSMVPELLKRVFQVTTEEYGAYRFIPSEPMEQGRAIRQMELEGHLDVGLFAPNEKRRNSAISVPIPVTGSLLSYRICLIRKGEKQRFENIKSLEDLIDSGLLIGQHQTWSDTNILRANRLELWTTHKYSLLFKQLLAKRFDCFSRGANEVLQEYYAHGYKGLEIEQSFIIHYPLPLYYFVNKAKPLLAERIQKGMTILIESGEYQHMFNYYFSDTVKLLNLPKRNILNLENPQLTEQARKQMLRDASLYKTLIKNAYLSK